MFCLAPSGLRAFERSSVALFRGGRAGAHAGSSRLPPAAGTPLLAPVRLCTWENREVYIAFSLKSAVLNYFK